MQHRSEKEILIEMIQYAQLIELLLPDDELIQAINDGKKTENQYILDLSTHAHILEQLEDKIVSCFDNIDLNKATGEALDILGRLLNVARYPAQPPQVQLEITSPAPVSEMVTIPAGTMVLMSDSSADEGNYYTATDLIFDANVQTGTVIAEHRDYGFHTPLAAGFVIGLQGFPYFAVTNSEEGTTGRNIEEDAEYRERIRNWVAKNTRGTRECFEDYLNNFMGLNSYNLIPCYDGVGTLKIVCDTLEDNLNDITEGVNSKCKLETDYPVVCVLPVSETLQNLSLTCHKNRNIQTTLTDSELINIISSQVNVFVNGGENRLGLKVNGLSIGADFNPSQLVSYLLENVPEVDNIVSNPSAVVPVDDTHTLKVGAVGVTLQ